MTANGPQEPQKPPYDERYHHHMNEKEEEKTEEKAGRNRNEKNWDEKWRRDPINVATWAIMFIWAGLVLLAENTHWGSDTFSWWNTGALIFTGVGIIILISALVRLVMPVYRRNVAGGLIPGAIFLGIGLSWFNDWKLDVIWPVILIIIGLAIILGGIFRSRK